MNSLLQTQIEEFNLDDPMSERGFSTRLAGENGWTIRFTQNAIREYKRFMYLAATSEEMVAPSHIVDIVWHQHIIFTISYSRFCRLLGKWIDHYPSTGSEDEREQFARAEVRTLERYEEEFNEQPPDLYWKYRDIYTPLNLGTARMGIGVRTSIILLLTLVACVPLYFLLKPIYITIDGSVFLIFYFPMIIATLLGLYLWNRSDMKKTFGGMRRDTFLYQLEPVELLYGERGALSESVKCCLVRLIKQKSVTIVGREVFSVGENTHVEDACGFSIIEEIKSRSRTRYSKLIAAMVKKPAFTNIAKSMDAFVKHLTGSKFIASLYQRNLIAVSALLSLGLVRLIIGVERDKPVGFLVALLVGLCGVTAFMLYEARTLMLRETIPLHYRMQGYGESSGQSGMEWRYILGIIPAHPAWLYSGLFKTSKRVDGNHYLGCGGGSCGGSGGGCGGGGGGGGCGGCGGGH